MIDSFEVINLPHSGRSDKPLGINVGDIIHLSGKHLLITGDNGVGKTTFLTALRDSLERNKKFLKGETFVKVQPYTSFVSEFDGQYGRMTWATQDDRGPILDAEILDALEAALKNYFGGNIVHLFHTGIPASSIPHVASAISKLIESENAIHNRELSNHSSNVFEVASDEFIKALKLYSKKHKIPLKKVCGGVLLMIADVFSGIDTEATAWGYIVPKAKKIEAVQRAKLITLLDGDGLDNGSLGERTMRTVESIPKSGAIVLLDEPTNGLSVEKSRIVRARVLAMTGSLIIATTHNEKLIEGAQEHPNWRVVNFPLST